MASPGPVRPCRLAIASLKRACRRVQAVPPGLPGRVKSYPVWPDPAARSVASRADDEASASKLDEEEEDDDEAIPVASLWPRKRARNTVMPYWIEASSAVPFWLRCHKDASACCNPAPAISTYTALAVCCQSIRTCFEGRGFLGFGCGSWQKAQADPNRHPFLARV
mmetsp:Transcript_66816/g.195362  ORF Transcript_66816/g.195362 Transcript_66816/m.195362 type:complete len:166 (+) Transcript_66816:75-572(+)